jgi:prepilin-type processing-associated H-X9-DG protein
MKFNTMLSAGTNMVLLGRLYKEGIITKGKAFYCPSETAPAQTYNTPVNPWPPKGNVQGGYANNPVVDWKSNPEPDRFPRLVELAGQPLLADGCGSPPRVDSRHKDGVNVLYTDGSVRWIKRELFDPELKAGNIPRIWEILGEN